jgi:hypothetical protein
MIYISLRIEPEDIFVMVLNLPDRILVIPAIKSTRKLIIDEFLITRCMIALFISRVNF